ncbi:PLP-dependent aminotransferase family protein [Dactylosporangium sp. NPDC000555]|uniref:MocR-like pyridoxine biosynthesis transcription factor PdxR n=1 Tax=Dactylosporangium sp. NPDC000555 TaxID=3154260 RepID=UPI00332747FA
MELHLHPGEAGDRVGSLYRQLREAIVDGRLRSGDRLPPTRTLAEDVGVARATVTAAYERLVAEGLADGRVGAGTFVAAGVRALQALNSEAPAAPMPVAGPLALSVVKPRPLPSEVRYDLRHGRPDPALFPLREWRALHVSEVSRTDLLRTAHDLAGEPALRAAVARHLGRSRGIAATAEDVVITRGTQQALDLLARTLLRPADVVAIESPAYIDAFAAFEGVRARLTGVPVDRDGLVVDRMPSRAALVYCTPAHQSPLGPVMSLTRRAALLAWARTAGAWVVEDDYDTEYRYDHRALDPMRTLDREGRVLYVGSVSKTLSPRLRVGWLLAPAAVRAAVLQVKEFLDPFGERATQRAMARFIDDGRLAVHVRRTGAVYAARREVLLEAVARELPTFDVIPGAAGLHITLTCDREPIDLDELVTRCARRGVLLRTVREASVSTSTPAPGTVSDGIILGFGTIEERDIPAATAEVARCAYGDGPRAR